jgi:hypothetical protein
MKCSFAPSLTAEVSRISIFSFISSFNSRDSRSFRLRALHSNSSNLVQDYCRWVTALARHLGELIRIFYVIQNRYRFDWRL